LDLRSLRLILSDGILVAQVIKAAEKAHLWPELVFLYIKYDEFVSTHSVSFLRT
jgi:hypothetical protein